MTAAQGQVTGTITPGAQTSEHAAMQSAGLWGNSSTILGLVATFGSMFIPNLGENTKYGIIAGAIIALAGLAQSTLTKLGYIQGRSAIKANAVASDNPPAQV